MSELISKDAALGCFHDWIDRYGHEHTADEDPVYQSIAELKGVEGREDAISRQAAIDALRSCQTYLFDAEDPDKKIELESATRAISELPAVQPDHVADIGKKVERAAETAQNTSSCAHENDLILRKAAIEAIIGMIDRFERILADIRASKGDDSVCGMCEYDGAYMGQSGDWCNECPGFDKDDCFKLSDRCRKRWMGDITLPSAQPEAKWIPYDERMPKEKQPVLVTDGSVFGVCEIIRTDYGLSWRDCIGYWFDFGEWDAWQPLPAPYKGGEKE